MEDNVTIAISPVSNVIPSQITDSNMVPGGTRVCPLCQSEVRLFFINFNEKMLMCENVNCEFPFGYEDLQFVKEDNEMHSDEEVMSINTSQGLLSASCSVVSGTAWAEIEKLNKACDDDNTFENRPLDVKEHIRLENVSSPNNNNESEQIMNNLEDLKGLMAQEEEDVEEQKIENAHWIKNLRQLQAMTGIKLVKNKEIDVLSNKKGKKQDLVIDIEKGSATGMSSIKIELNNMEKGKK